jgi:hypothetical protein
MDRVVRIATVFWFLVFLAAAGFPLRAQVMNLDNVLREAIGLNDSEIRSIHSGAALAKVMESRIADEVFVFGAVRIGAQPESYVRLATDLDALRKLPNYLAVRNFSAPPQISDLDEFTLDPDDMKELPNCKPGDCEVQLPSEAMEDFRRAINWSGPDVAGQVNRRARQMALEALLQYSEGGNAALGAYRDKSQPTKVAETFESLLNRLDSLPVYLPELNRFLLEYPRAEDANIASEFYWENVNFGLKPTFRIVQRIVYRGSTPDQPACAVALKQLYASHYFQTALDLTVCIRDPDRSEPPAFYLITVKASQQAGLTGLKGSILRKIAVDKTRSSLEKALVAIKQKLEAPGR